MGKTQKVKNKMWKNGSKRKERKRKKRKEENRRIIECEEKDREEES